MRPCMRTLPALSIAIVAFAVASSACGGTQKTNLTPTHLNPAAQGKVETRRDENRNTEVDLEVKYMAPPQAVADNATVYVVWAKPIAAPEESTPQNLGSLVVGKDRKASLKTITPYEKFDLTVTPEPSGNVEKPSHEPVMKAKVGPR
jgi:hypothetical protein